MYSFLNSHISFFLNNEFKVLLPKELPCLVEANLDSSDWLSSPQLPPKKNIKADIIGKQAS